MVNVLLVVACAGPARPAASGGAVAAGQSLDASEAPATVDPDLEELRADHAWLLPADACPVDVAAPGRHEAGAWGAENCSEALRGCLARCRAGSAVACYASALRVQELGEERLSEALFLRGCRQGNDSACTNRAAGMLMLEPERADRLTCSARTFEETCKRRDAWGCTMFGGALLHGAGVAPDYQRARSVLPFACTLDDEDQACEKARGLLDELDAAEGAAKDPKSPLM